ncbi:MAG: cytidylate kinase-like family protein [Oscillospiraceae bacterium]
MSNQLMISVSREFASGGREIAKVLAERFQINYYDRNLLDEIAAEKMGNIDKLRMFDEVPRHRFLTRTFRGMSSSPAENVAQIQFEYLMKKAESGESFVIVGRCADEVLSDYDSLVKIFVLADEECKIDRICESRNVNPDEARGILQRHDKMRRQYHNYFCDLPWGDSRGYDITINSSRLGIEKTADFLQDYVQARVNK